MLAEWQIKKEEYLKRLNLNEKDFEEQLCLPDTKAITQILPLKNIKKILSLIPISQEMLLNLIWRIKTLDGGKPFLAPKIKMIKMDPRHLKIGQKFVYRENYQKILEEVPDIFNRFLISGGGLSDLGAYFIFGLDENNSYSLACYAPPIVEQHEFNLVIMDGIHRNYIAKQAGLTLNVILIENVDLPFPCAIKDWSEIKIISLSDKPKNIKERYFELQQGLFRDLKYLGIDG